MSISLTRPDAAESYECGICLEICGPKIAETDCCGKIYCWACLHKVFRKTNRKCPNCRKGNFKRHESRALMRMLNDEAAKCDDCDAAISRFGDVEGHTYICEEAEVCCGNKIEYMAIDNHNIKETVCTELACNWTGKRRELSDHQEHCNQLQGMVDNASAMCGGIEGRQLSVNYLYSLLDTGMVQFPISITPQGLRTELEARGMFLLRDDWLALETNGNFLRNVTPERCDEENGICVLKMRDGNQTVPLYIGTLYQTVIDSFTIAMNFDVTNERISFDLRAPDDPSHDYYWDPCRPTWGKKEQENFDMDCKKACIPEFLKSCQIFLQTLECSSSCSCSNDDESDIADGDDDDDEGDDDDDDNNEEDDDSTGDDDNNDSISSSSSSSSSSGSSSSSSDGS